MVPLGWFLSSSWVPGAAYKITTQKFNINYNCLANHSDILLTSSYNWINPFILIYVLLQGCGLLVILRHVTPSAAMWHLPDSALSFPHLCLDFTSSYILSDHLLKQIYSSTNKSNAYSQNSGYSTSVNLILHLHNYFNCFCSL